MARQSALPRAVGSAATFECFRHGPANSSQAEFPLVVDVDAILQVGLNPW
jgi:hypothetical protein